MLNIGEIPYCSGRSILKALSPNFYVISNGLSTLGINLFFFCFGNLSFLKWIHTISPIWISGVAEVCLFSFCWYLVVAFSMFFCVCLWMFIIFSACGLVSPCVLWSPIETKCEQYVIFLLLFSETAKLPITIIPLYLIFVSLLGSNTKLDQVCSGRRHLLPLSTWTVIQTNKNKRFLDQSVCLIWFLSNLEWLLIV